MALFPVAGLEPLGQQLLVQGDMLQQPGVADFIQTSPDVSLLHPRGAAFLGEHDEALLQGIGTPAALAKAIGVSVGQNLSDGCERQRVKRVQGAVVHDGNA